MKGIILCAGKGSRIQPYSFSLPKTLLPVGNRPVLDHCVEKLLTAGIRDIGVVIHPSQRAIGEHLMKYSDIHVEILHQHQPRGIADALAAARTFIGDDSFVLLLGDNLIQESLDTVVKAFAGNAGSILLAHVDNPSEYGVAQLADGKVTKLVEKPKVPASNLAVVGIYAFTPNIFAAIDQLQPSERGEYEITEAIQWLIDQGHTISCALTEQPFSDVGTVDRWLQANHWTLRQRLGTAVQVGQNTRLENCILRGPIVIGDDCTLVDAVLGPNVAIAAGSTVRNCTVSDSICLEYSTLENIQIPIRHSVFGRESTLRLMGDRESSLRCILSDKSQVLPNESQNH